MSAVMQNKGLKLLPIRDASLRHFDFLFLVHVLFEKLLFNIVSIFHSDGHVTCSVVSSIFTAIISILSLDHWRRTVRSLCVKMCAYV